MDAGRTRRTAATKLRQVMLSLLSNAVKFTARGSVTLTVRSHPDVVQVTVVETQENQGSAFHFTIPLDVAA